MFVETFSTESDNEVILIDPSRWEPPVTTKNGGIYAPIYVQLQLGIFTNPCHKFKPFIWSNYSDLSRGHLKLWFSKGNPLISVKSRLVKYYNLARFMYVPVCHLPSSQRLNHLGPTTFFGPQQRSQNCWKFVSHITEVSRWRVAYLYKTFGNIA